MEKLVTIEPDKRIYYIYFITHNLTGQVYVGYTVQAKNRWERHKEKVFCDRPQERFYIHKAIAKHGVDNFTYELIEKYDDLEECKQAEIFYIEYLRTIGAKMYNLTRGGEGCTGRIISEETRKKIGNAHRGTKHSDKTKQLLSEKQLGKRVPFISVEKAASKRRGEILNEERRKIISESTRGVKKTIGSQLTEAQADEIIEKYKTENYTHQMLGTEYNVSTSTIGKIVSGKPCPRVIIKGIK